MAGLLVAACGTTTSTTGGGKWIRTGSSADRVVAHGSDGSIIPSANYEREGVVSMDKEKLFGVVREAGLDPSDIELFVKLARFAELVRADDKQDAERYRFLRACDIPAGAGGAHCIIKGQFGMTVGDGEDLDRAIDNAMSARGKQEKV